MSAERQWSDLPPELLALVSDGLHDFADFIRFHAVCKAWRDSLPATTLELRRTFFPWLIDAPSGSRPLVIRLRCVFSRRGYYTAAPAGLSTRSWVARADGTAPYARLKNTLLDPLTGDTIPVPPFPDGTKLGYSREVVYADGTLFFYGLSETYEDDVPTSFRAAILRPGDSAWTIVESRDRGHDIWHLLAPSPGGGGHATTVVEDDDMCQMTKPADELVSPKWRLESSHVLESRGELLRVSVLIRWHEYPTFLRNGACGEERLLMVLVHALEEKGTRWARRDSRSFTDHVLFLGFPISFAMEAANLGSREGHAVGGCVYFLQDSTRWPRRVFRYNLVDGKTKTIDRLHRGCRDGARI
ncbi:unnamed protein product [Alopecurus aequalis]